MAQINLHCTSPFWRKLVGNKSVQISASGLENTENKHHITLSVSKQFANKFHRSVNLSKGLRFPQDSIHIHGGSILSSACKIAHSVPKSFIRDVSGLALKEGLKQVDPQYRDIGNAVGKLAIDRVTAGSLFGDIGRLAGKKAIDRFVPAPLQGLSNLVIDEGLKSNGMGFKKGSAEAKQKMANLRAMKKTGGKLNILGALRDVGNKLGEPFKKSVGINPFTMGEQLGEHVIGPALIKAGMGVGKKGGSIADNIDSGIRTAAPIWNKIGSAKKLFGLGIVSDVVSVAKKGKKLVGLGVKPKMRKGGSFLQSGGSFSAP